MSNPIKDTKKADKDLETLRNSLPYTAVSQIYKKKKQKISKRLIQMILSGTANDYHKVIPAAIKIAAAEKAKKAALKKSLQRI